MNKLSTVSNTKGYYNKILNIKYDFLLYYFINHKKSYKSKKIIYQNKYEFELFQCVASCHSNLNNSVAKFIFQKLNGSKIKLSKFISINQLQLEKLQLILYILFMTIVFSKNMYFWIIYNESWFIIYSIFAWQKCIF